MSSSSSARMTFTTCGLVAALTLLYASISPASCHLHPNSGNSYAAPPPQRLNSAPTPPTVRPPPYFSSLKRCSDPNDFENWQGNLCGDLNKGEIPVNPLGHQEFPGESSSYPFELMKNKTLEFFRHALPVLKTYKSLPKVARFVYPTDDPYSAKFAGARRKRAAAGTATNSTGSATADANAKESDRQARSGFRVKRTQVSQQQHKTPTHYYGNSIMRQNRGGGSGSSSSAAAASPPGGNHCENAILCKLFNTVYDKLPSGFQRLVGEGQQKRQSHNYQHYQNQHYQHFQQAHRPQNPTSASAEYLAQESSNHLPQSQHGVKPEGDAHFGSPLNPKAGPPRVPAPPGTPCPSSAEYLTPVFARNHEGAWRYVVQIPREGYFTQTVEVTKCAQANCMYMDGGCRSSPRWQSLLVAEMFYPDAVFPPSVDGAPAVKNKQNRLGGIGAAELRQQTLDEDDDDDDDSYNDGRQGRRLRREAGGDIGNNSSTMLIAGDRPRRSSRLAPAAVYKEGRFYEGKEAERFVKGAYNNEQGSAATDQVVTANHVSESKHCDGYDEIGCYQFRLFYDWFLIPGECKCWKRSSHPFY